MTGAEIAFFAILLGDFARVGTPLTVLVAVVVTSLAPLLWSE